MHPILKPKTNLHFWARKNLVGARIALGIKMFLNPLIPTGVPPSTIPNPMLADPGYRTAWAAVPRGSRRILRAQALLRAQAR